MSNIFLSKTKSTVETDTEQINYLKKLANVKEGRSNLGEEMPVFVYRLFEFSMRESLIEEFGKEKMIEVFRKAGEKSGRELAVTYLDMSVDYDTFLSDLQNLLENLKIGILRIESFNSETGHAILTISEDLDCSGLPITHETVCNYDEGFIAGILKEYTKKNYNVIEIDCWATRARACRFDARINSSASSEE